MNEKERITLFGFIFKLGDANAAANCLLEFNTEIFESNADTGPGFSLSPRAVGQNPASSSVQEIGEFYLLYSSVFFGWRECLDSQDSNINITKSILFPSSFLFHRI